MYLLTENTNVSMYLYVHLLKIYNEWILFLLFYIKKKKIENSWKNYKNIIKKVLQLFMLLVGLQQIAQTLKKPNELIAVNDRQHKLKYLQWLIEIKT